ncbi:RNA methyltransferase [Alkalimarinus sediminis]|uniref:tRNA (cytidine/uridine-2'-O-)-methyltransferase TrmJ n=1 Tax=Alkalimarinus sediminis TaxID=1632866 RepID=A0A9E8KR40_9ALTE|nr:RNA methyltransferase [Alkalimarinus sediminis]UZW75890.1 RNA methyltransferase [Alkalimarinus sediminis]
MYSNVRIVMMNTSHPGNIGAVARAMKNMGLAELCLVAPKSFPDIVAERRAAGAKDILANTKVVETFDEAIEGCVSVIGTSARGRKIPWPVMNPRDCAAKVREYALMAQKSGEFGRNGEEHGNKVAIVLGREDRGLSNDELQRCNYHVHIPTNPHYSSLNVAMALQVVAYELRMDFLLHSGLGDAKQASCTLSPENEGWDEPLATTEEVEGLIGHLEDVMIKTEFFDPDNPRQLIPRLRRLFQRSRMDKIEVNIVRGFLNTVLKAIGDKR